MESVMSALNLGISAATLGAVKPVQSLAYPCAWTGNHLRFIPNRPPWLRPQPSYEGNIYLSLTEDRTGFSIGLVAREGAAKAAGDITYEFEEPYYLFGPKNRWNAAVSWGESARRVVWAYGPPSQVLLCGVSIPSDGDPLEDYVTGMNRVVVKWRIPRGENDFTRYLTFDEATGVAVIAMASGHIWIADPTAPSTETIHPDPAWPSGHPTPWPYGLAQSWVQDEDLDDRPSWTSSIEKFFPDKNRPDCFGGATWFVNEALHIRGTAEVFLCTNPQPWRYVNTELIRFGERVLVVENDEDGIFHEAWMLPTESTVESVKVVQ
ncbi:hypothetical protein FRC01_005318 [Tulasnella sp. 417]|nr:hypothetical protein FRC01_005318 [Tulasnella sp. 417]